MMVKDDWDDMSSDAKLNWLRLNVMGLADFANMLSKRIGDTTGRVIRIEEAVKQIEKSKPNEKL